MLCQHEITRPGGHSGNIVLRDHPAECEAGKPVGRCERGVQVLAPNIVEIHIEPVWGHLQQGLCQIAGRFIVYDVIDADLLEKRAFVGAARRSYDRVPLDLGDLTDDRADGAGRG